MTRSTLRFTQAACTLVALVALSSLSGCAWRIGGTTRIDCPCAERGCCDPKSEAKQTTSSDPLDHQPAATPTH